MSNKKNEKHSLKSSRTTARFITSYSKTQTAGAFSSRDDKQCSNHTKRRKVSNKRFLSEFTDEWQEQS